MDDFRKLLELDSELSWHLRHTLYGLRASLSSALEANPNDEGAELCLNLINKLNLLLQEDSPKLQDNISLGDNLSLDESYVHAEESLICESKKLILDHIKDIFKSDRYLYDYFSDIQFQSTTDSELWSEVQRSLLRISEPMAKNLQQKFLQLAYEAGAETDLSKVVRLPFFQDGVRYPGLKGTVEAKGLRLSVKATLDKRISAENLDGDLMFLAQIVSICLYFIENDSSLKHCLKSIYRFKKIVPLDIEQKNLYINALLSCFHCVVSESKGNPINSLKARLDLDEAIHSLVYLPLSEPDSWWGKIQESVRKTIEPAITKVRQSGYEAGYQWLLGIRDNVIDYTENDVPYPLETGGVPGKIMLCLRVYAWINEEKLSGRVIYFPR